MQRLVFLSDTHNKLSKINVPDGDVLIHAGDATMLGKVEEVSKFLKEFNELPHKHKIYIAGNHDGLYENSSTESVDVLLGQFPDIHYLQDSGITLDGLNYYGSPATPHFMDWYFNYDQEELEDIWAKVPDNTDVLITHGPPHGILDAVGSRIVGDELLLNRVLEVRPKIHVFGHIHEGAGRYFDGHTHFVNAAVLDEYYSVANDPIVIDV